MISSYRLSALAVGFVVLPLTVNASPQLRCDANSYLVKAHNRRAYLRADGTKVSASHVDAYCKSRSAIYDAWISRFGAKPPPGWPDGEKSKDWTDEERERILEILEELPSSLTSQPTKALLRFDKSKVSSANPGAFAANYIVLYDAAFSPHQKLVSILAHEFSHQLYES